LTTEVGNIHVEQAGSLLPRTSWKPVLPRIYFATLRVSRFVPL